MEAILFIIIIVLILTNNSKTGSLEKRIEQLLHKINDLSRQVSSLKNLPIQKKEVEIAKEVKTTAQTVEEKKHKIDEKIKDIIEARTVKPEKEKTIITPAAKITPTLETKPKKKEVVELKKPFIKQTSLSDKFNEKINRFKKRNPDLETFIGENLISKIGILILVLGISFFVKYAIDQNWINEIGRVGIGFLSGSILLGFAFRLKENFKAFSSILVSGAMVVFYFIVAYAFKEYQLFSQTMAFSLMVLITVFSTTISILYNRKELAILSIIGGFAVPILASNGSGNYMVLFAYILILDIGFLIVSLKRKWFIINILAFVFTHFFFLSWIFTNAKLSEQAPNLFIFASLFYLVFYAMNIFRILKEKNYAMKPIVMTLFLISTFVFFGQGLYLLNEFVPSLKGAFTILLAVINLGSGWFLQKKGYIDKKTVYLFIGLTLTFLTLAGPIQLTGNYITLFWAAESVMLIWLSQKIKNHDFKIIGFITIGLALISLFMYFTALYNSSTKLNIIFNKGFVTGLFCVFSFGLATYLIYKEKATYKIRGINFNTKSAAITLSAITGVVLYLTGLLEVSHQTEKHFDHYLSNTIITIYNYGFVTLAIFYLFKKESLRVFANIISIVAILYSIIYFSSIPFSSFYDSFTNNHVNPVFYVQFILLLLVLNIMRALFNHFNKSEQKHSNIKAINYFIATVFVILVSLELLIISKPIILNMVASNTIDPNFSAYNIINQSQINVIKTSFPILWGLLSFVFLYFGIKKPRKEWRIFALILVAITIFKLFIYDIGNASKGGKIIAFIILGIVLLVISFMYQKIKKALFDNENKD